MRHADGQCTFEFTETSRPPSWDTPDFAGRCVVFPPGGLSPGNAPPLGFSGCFPCTISIAITIDEPTLELLDALAREAPRGRSRSALVRIAVREFAERERQRRVEARESEIIHRHRKRLAAQTRALVASQARP